MGSGKIGPILLLVAIGGFLFYLSWKPSSSGIAEEMSVDAAGKITHDGHSYETEWGEDRRIEGHLRVKERHYDENLPVITWTFLITTGEYSDPDIVELTSYGDGNFRWQAPRQPTGSLNGYHLVPATPAAEAALQALDEGDEVVLEGKFSQSGRLTSDTGAFVQLTHSNHKFMLLSTAAPGVAPTS